MINELWQDILEQGPAIARQRFRLLEAHDWIRKSKIDPGRTILTGLGTSLFAWETARPLVEGYGPSILDTGELIHYHRPLLERAEWIVVISRSGESAELLHLLRTVHPGQRIIGITEQEEGPLVSRAEKVFRLDSRERSFANTQSFTLSIGFAQAIAAGLRDFPSAWLERALSDLSPQVESLVRKIRSAEDVASRLDGLAVLLIVVRGNLIGIGRQLELDLHEGVRLPAITVPGSMLRHGTIELTTRKDAVTLFLIGHDEAGELMTKAAVEVARRGGKVCAIGPTELPVGFFPFIPLPRVEDPAQPMLYSVATQMLYYAVACRHGISTIAPQLVERVTRVE